MNYKTLAGEAVNINDLKTDEIYLLDHGNNTVYVYITELLSDSSTGTENKVIKYCIIEPNNDWENCSNVSSEISFNEPELVAAIDNKPINLQAIFLSNEYNTSLTSVKELNRSFTSDKEFRTRNKRLAEGKRQEDIIKLFIQSSNNEIKRLRDVQKHNRNEMYNSEIFNYIKIEDNEDFKGEPQDKIFKQFNEIDKQTNILLYKVKKLRKEYQSYNLYLKTFLKL